VTINVRSPSMPHWTPLEPPTSERPYWSEEDGTRHAFRSIVIGVDSDTERRLEKAHLEAVGRLVEQAIEHQKAGKRPQATRLAVAAGRLCEEVVGRWPASACAVPRN